MNSWLYRWNISCLADPTVTQNSWTRFGLELRNVSSKRMLLPSNYNIWSMLEYRTYSNSSLKTEVILYTILNIVHFVLDRHTISPSCKEIWQANSLWEKLSTSVSCEPVSRKVWTFQKVCSWAEIWKEDFQTRLWDWDSKRDCGSTADN